MAAEKIKGHALDVILIVEHKTFPILIVEVKPAVKDGNAGIALENLAENRIMLGKFGNAEIDELLADLREGKGLIRP